MNLRDALQGVTRLFLDTAPVVYYVEKASQWFPQVEIAFDLIDAGTVTAVTSPVTLAECLVAPFRLDLTEVQTAFQDLITYGNNTLFVPIGDEIGRRAAALRADYNLTLPDALQIAVALHAGCDAFLTNDGALSNVSVIRVLVLNRLDA